MKKMYRVSIKHSDNECDGWNFDNLEDARKCYDEYDIAGEFYTGMGVRGRARFMRGKTYSKSIIPVLVDEFGTWERDDGDDEIYDLPAETYGYEDYRKAEEEDRR